MILTDARDTMTYNEIIELAAQAMIDAEHSDEAFNRWIDLIAQAQALSSKDVFEDMAAIVAKLIDASE